MKYVFSIFFIILTACTQASVTTTELLYKVELRNISADEITEYRFFKNGLVNYTVTHSTSHNADLFQSKFQTLDSDQIIEMISLQRGLQELDYYNHFPWKEDFYKRGNVVKIEFPDLVKPSFITEPGKVEEILVDKVYYYYDGEAESPKVFQELVKLINSIN